MTTLNSNDISMADTLRVASEIEMLDQFVTHYAEEEPTGGSELQS